LIHVKEKGTAGGKNEDKSLSKIDNWPSFGDNTTTSP